MFTSAVCEASLDPVTRALQPVDHVTMGLEGVRGQVRQRQAQLLWYYEFATNLDQYVMRRLELLILQHFGSGIARPITISLFNYKIYSECSRAVIKVLTKLRLRDTGQQFVFLVKIAKAFANFANCKHDRFSARLNNTVNQLRSQFVEPITDELLNDVNIPVPFIFQELQIFFRGFQINLP